MRDCRAVKQSSCQALASFLEACVHRNCRFMWWTHINPSKISPKTHQKSLGFQSSPNGSCLWHWQHMEVSWSGGNRIYGNLHMATYDTMIYLEAVPRKLGAMPVQWWQPAQTSKPGFRGNPKKATTDDLFPNKPLLHCYMAFSMCISVYDLNHIIDTYTYITIAWGRVLHMQQQRMAEHVHEPKINITYYHIINYEHSNTHPKNHQPISAHLK